MKHIRIVAEIGCNHNGDKRLAQKMIAVAKECGVDAVKFQTFNAQKLISKYSPKADYQKKTTGEDESQLEMTKRLELSREDYCALKEYAQTLSLDVFSTPFDMESIDFLESTGQTVWKIPSGEITNLPFLERIGKIREKNKRVLLSTGMAEMDEIVRAVDILLNRGIREEEITVLHCHTEYPTPDEDVNISAILDLKKHFPRSEVGYSDHSVGSVAAIGAVMLGASLIEKHFTLDKNMSGPDHRASATPEELSDMVRNIRRVEAMYGTEVKTVTVSEMNNRIAARKSIVASKRIEKGEVFSENNITCKRPGNGISPMAWNDVMGRRAEAEFLPDELIKMAGIQWQDSED